MRTPREIIIRPLMTEKSMQQKEELNAISFRVADITAAIKELKRAGVVFEDYDFPGLKTVDHVCVLGAEKAAWFEDTEGNILCLHEDIG